MQHTNGYVVLFCLTILLSACTGLTNPDLPMTIDQPSAATEADIEQPELVSNKILAVVDGTAVVLDTDHHEVTLFKGQKEVALSSFSEDHPVREYVQEILVDLDRGVTSIRPPVISSFRRISNSKGEVSIDDIVLKTQSVSGGHLADAWVIVANSSGFWVQQEELLESKLSYKSQQVYRLNPVGALRHYDPNGGLVAQVSVTLVKPRKHLDYFHIDDQNRAFYIEYQSATKKMVPRRLDLTSPGALSIPTDHSSDDTIFTVDDDSVKSFESLIRSSDTNVSALRPPITSRAHIIERAEEILNTRWLLSANNFSSKKTNTCRQPENIWLRPKKLKSTSIDSEVLGPPYKWGGNQSLGVFKQKIAEGYTAGDICTCRCRKGPVCTARDWCIDASTVGFDCSGFVSNAWAIPYHSTSTLHKVSVPIRWQELQPGDILNSPGRHVRLFVSFVDGDVTKIQTIESAVSCSGLCKKNYRVSELAGYIPYRYMNLE